MCKCANHMNVLCFAGSGIQRVTRTQRKTKLYFYGTIRDSKVEHTAVTFSKVTFSNFQNHEIDNQFLHSGFLIKYFSRYSEQTTRY